MANRHVKRCSLSLIIREMQIKTTRRYHLTPLRTAIINKSANNKCGEDVEKRNLVHCWWDADWCSHYGKQYRGSSKNSKWVCLWHSDSSSGNISEETQNTNLKEYMHPCIHCSIIYNSQDMEAAQVPISRQVDKKAVVHLHNGILLSHKKEWNLTICDSMDGPRVYYAQGYKLVRERQIPPYFTYMWNLKNKINKTDTDS